MKDKKTGKSVILFLVITIVLSFICNFIYISVGKKAKGMTSILMWCPAIAAFIVKAKYYRGVKLLGWNRCKVKYALLGILIPVIYLGVSYGAYFVFNSKAFTGKIGTDSILTLFLLIPSALIPAAGEEIGWRGFLLPQLNKLWNLKIAVLACGLIWALWHFPLLIAGLYQSGTVLWYQLPVFTVSAVGTTAIMAYLRIKSESVWPVIIIHAAHNYLNGVIFGPLTKYNNQAYFVGETGFITVLLVVAFAVFLLGRMKTQNTPEKV